MGGVSRNPVFMRVCGQGFAEWFTDWFTRWFTDGLPSGLLQRKKYCAMVMMRRSVGSLVDESTGLFSRPLHGAAGFILSPLPLFGGRDGKVDAMDCFAMKEDGSCNILSGGKCEGETCHFHKTHEEQAQSLEKVNERLRSLPEYQQEAIADKYYGGVRKW